MEFQQFNEEYSRLYKEDDGLYRRLAKHFRLSESAFWILYTLEASQQPLTQAELCGWLYLSKQTINSGLKQLEQEGRIRLSDGPGRKKYLRLSDTGRALAARTVRPVIEIEERAFLSMTQEEQEDFLRLTRLHLELMLRESEAILNTPQEE